jgi:hypothetical protein
MCLSAFLEMLLSGARHRRMTDQELLAELVSHKALIVHCSRPGKSGEGADALLFPDDMLKAVDICDAGNHEICCSVIWPRHVKTFGDVGIILKPRSTLAITMISTTDGGTMIDLNTGRRIGLGAPFSRKTVADTFVNSTDYNEWNIDAADAIGIFVKDGQVPQIASWLNISEVPGYDPIMGSGQILGSRDLEVEEIERAFPHLPILTIRDGEIRTIEGSIVSPYA